MIQNDAHGNPPHSSVHSAVNGIFVHLLYGPVQLNRSGSGLSPTGSVYILGSPVVPYSLGVPLQTTLMAMQHWAVNTLPPTELLYTRCVKL